ncbi:MAG: trypsin-like peptidase domain-containing protein [candidate division NC10 bacterium]|nr:trypsin-like peptidase domain-containing protein [candidate division NC10 bacterium]
MLTWTRLSFAQGAFRLVPAALLLLALAAPAAAAPLFAEGTAGVQAPADLRALNQSLTGLVRRVRPAVVRIGAPDGPAAERPTPEQPGPEERPRVGTGFFVSPDGFLVTNHHVVAEGSEVELRLFDGRRLPAKVVGKDARSDLALLKAEGGPFPILPLGDSDAVEIGELVLAVGNPFGLEATVTIGLVSRKGRGMGGAGPFDDFIQTDAAINPGNSGGPLVNIRGEAVGVNVAVIPNRSIGFAIPTNLVKTVLPALLEKGRVAWGFLGVGVQNLSPAVARALGRKETDGVLVNSVMPGLPAEAAGIRRGDLILKFNGTLVKDVAVLQRTVSLTAVGAAAEVELVRDGAPRTLTVTVGEFRQPVAEAAVPERRMEAALGLTVEELDAEKAKKFKVREQEGLVVAEVQEGGPAAAAGLRVGDLVAEVNRAEVRALPEYRRALRSGKGAVNLLLIKRGDAYVYVALEARG